MVRTDDKYREEKTTLKWRTSGVCAVPMGYRLVGED